MFPLRTVCDEPSFKVVIVTPSMASEWLESNTHNRNLRQTRVDSYARDMADGNWKLNGDAIRFSVDGTLLDGQHRLSAIVKAGVAIKTLVVWDLPPETQETMDAGQCRTASNALTLRGFGHPTIAASIARTTIRYLRGHRCVGGAGSVTHAEIISYIQRNPDDIYDAVEVAKKASHGVLPCSPSIVGSAYYLCAKINRDDAQDFYVVRLINGLGLSEHDPVRLLREMLFRRRSQTFRNMKDDDVVRYAFKAWNAYRRKEPMSQLKAPPGGWTAANFPIPK